ncbi:hypothetical protein [Salibacterium sp. K-3]
MAAPHVSGGLALLLHFYTFETIKTFIINRRNSNKHPTFFDVIKTSEKLKLEHKKYF